MVQLNPCAAPIIANAEAFDDNLASTIAPTPQGIFCIVPVYNKVHEYGAMLSGSSDLN